MTPILHREVQRFRQPWLLALIALLAAAGVGTAWAVAPRLPSPALAPLLLLPYLVPAALLLILRMDVEVREDVLLVRFFPLKTRRVAYADIRRCEATTYRPIREYGGWGLRWGGPGKWAYNVRGNRGVLLSLADGSTLLLGSQEPEILAEAIRRRLPEP